MLTFLIYCIATGVIAAAADKLLPPDDSEHDYDGAYPPRFLCVGAAGLGWPVTIPIAVSCLFFYLTKKGLNWIK